MLNLKDSFRGLQLRRWTIAGRVASLVVAVDSDSIATLEPRLLAEIRRLAERRARPMSPLHRFTRKVGVVATEGEAALAILQKWSFLSESARRVIGRTLGSDLAGAARLWMSSDEADRLKDAADAVCHCPPADAMPVIELLLRSDVDEARRRAAEWLADIPVGADGEDHDLDGVLGRLLADGPSLKHRDALICALGRLHRPGPAVQRVLDDEGHPTHLLLRSLIRTKGAAVSPRTLVTLLAVDAVSAAARDAIERRTTPEDIAELGGASHLLLSPARRDRLRAGGPSRKWLAEVCAAPLERASLRALPCLLDQCGVLDSSPVGFDLARLIVNGDRAAKAALALRAGRRLRPDARLCDALCDLSFDADGRIARRALFAIQNTDSPALTAISKRQAKSPHVVCRIASEWWLRRHDMEIALRRFDPQVGTVALRSALRHNREETLDAIRSAIQSGEADTRVVAMLWSRRLAVAPECELELLAALTSEDARLVATSVGALGRVSSDAAAQALVACLSHPDARVRANVIEAMAHRDLATHLHPECVESDHPRIRANAARAFLLVRTEPKLRRRGIRILDDMAQDERADHRRSAMWLTERLARTESAHIVARIAAQDPEPAVRRRARRTAHRLLAEMRADIAVRIEPPRHANAAAE